MKGDLCMTRDEILTRNKASNPKDEGKAYVEDKARRYGEIGLCIVFALLIIYNFFKGKSTYDLLAIFWGYLGMNYIYKYKANKTKGSLVTAICGIVAAVCFLLVYVLQTW